MTHSYEVGFVSSSRRVTRFELVGRTPDGPQEVRRKSLRIRSPVHVGLRLHSAQRWGEENVQEERDSPADAMI